MTCSLTPINLSSSSEREDLLHQRLACGWDNTPEKLLFWQEKQQAGLKSFFWITLTPKEQPDSSSTPTPITSRAGHISLDAYADPPDPDQANASKTNLTIQTFFILPEHRFGGVGSQAMKMVEELAVKEPFGSPNCEFITLTCLNKKNYYDQTLAPLVQALMPICNQEWYERQGYVLSKEEERVTDNVPPDGRTVAFSAALMRKRVRSTN